MAAGLEQENLSAPLRELARDDATAGPRANHDHLEALVRRHPVIPRYDQSLSIRMASGEWKSIAW